MRHTWTQYFGAQRSAKRMLRAAAKRRTLRAEREVKARHLAMLMLLAKLRRPHI